jgi:hypothetical protein
MEYLFQMMRVVERRREPKSRTMNVEAPYLLLNREAFEVVHRINRMPGILNEAGWNLWSHQLEGLRTFDGDGSRWIWREIGFSSWPNYSDLDRRIVRRSTRLITAATIASMVPVAGLVYGFYFPIESFLDAMILALSAVSYALMTISYFLYARRLHGATWFAPLWFLSQPAAAVLTLFGVRKMVAQERLKDASLVQRVGPGSPSSRRRGGDDPARKTSRYS